MNADQTSNRVYATALIAVVVVAILWAFYQPNAWLWALGFGVGVSLLVMVVFNAGRSEGIADAEILARIKTESEVVPYQVTAASNNLADFENALTEIDFFGYELANGLIPDGNSKSNLGLGPMDFDEWREWKRREFDRTGNLRHNHPDGRVPIEK